MGRQKPSLSELPPLQPDLSFRMNRGFYFAGLARLTGGSLASRLILIGREWRQHHVLRRASEYLHRLFEVNASRVYEDLRQRVFESRRALETELRVRLNHLSESAKRAFARAQQTRQRGEEAVRGEEARLASVLRAIDAEVELLHLPSARLPSISSKGTHVE